MLGLVQEVGQVQLMMFGEEISQTDEITSNNNISVSISALFRLS